MVKGCLNARLVIKMTEMASEFAQLRLERKDRDVGCRVLKTQLLHVSTEIQCFPWFCDLFYILLLSLIFGIFIVITIYFLVDILNDLIVSSGKWKFP